MPEIDELKKRIQELEGENEHLKVEGQTYRVNLEALVKARIEQLQTALRNLERSNDLTLEALSEALDIKETSAAGHSRRVTAFSIGISQALGLPGERVAVIARGAFLHDIGKMATPDAILRKPDKLTAEERAIMQEHPYRGYQIVKKFPFVAGESAEIIYAHHERFDGQGYPRGLKSDEIPLGARIVAVANTLDSISSNLPYRSARTLSVAREEIEKHSGQQFDPEIVKVFLNMPDKIWEDLRRQVQANPAQ